MKRPVAEITPELLAEQHLYIRLIIDHENEHVHARSPEMAYGDSDSCGAARQNDPKLGELAGLGIDLYRPASVA